ncbi:MAG: hypothetical protein LiPW15_711 [Parcubacteria group bacterium LiPW_15]|nr:MAG: hypothetical protein LiPW15_711 [Parcubacteria group bacterium LiPW_15]
MPDDPEKHFQVALEAKLKKFGVWFNFIEKPESTIHTADAAGITGIELHRISKNLMAQTNDGRYAALIVPGDMRVDYKAAAKLLDAKNISLVPFAEAHKISGIPQAERHLSATRKKWKLFWTKSSPNTKRFIAEEVRPECS